MKEATLDRRTFLKDAAVVGAGAAMAGATVAVADEAPAADIAPGDLAALGQAPQIDDALIAETFDCDVLVIGCGISGLAAARSAAELGVKTIVLEKNRTNEIHGFQCGVVNSSFGKAQGAEVDPLDIIREYEKRSYGRVNMQLVSLWAHKSGEVFDWYSNVADDLVKDNMDLMYWPEHPEHDPAGDLFKTFIGAIDLKEDPHAVFEVSPWKHLGDLNQAAAEAAGAQFMFSCAAQKLLTAEDGAVVGAVALREDGSYIKVNAKSVILTTGGFTQFGAGSEVMHKVFCPNIVKNYRLANGGAEPKWQPMFTVNPGPIQGTTGDGQLMAVWVGGQMDAYCDVSMASCESAIGGTVGLTVNQMGKRFFNEDIGIWEKHDQVFNQPGRTVYTIIDANWRDCLPYQACGHRNFDYNEHQVAGGITGYEYVDIFNDEFESCVGNPDGIITSLNTHAGKTYGAETLEELAEFIGVPVDTFLATVERYNQMVAQKRDDDFGLDPQKLFPIATPPFYACSATANPSFAAYAGLKADGDLHVIGADGNPIPGLYTAGNCCGMKFGPGYFTPMCAMNHGNGITHGFFAGKNAALGI